MLLTNFHPQSVIPESYRAVRTSLLFSRAERPPQIILLTSASPGEGKTSTSLNLGIALAQDGHRVLLIDADLRKGCVHQRLGMTNHKGLSNVLVGKLAVEESVQTTQIDGLSLLSCGVCPPSPADLLGSDKMKQVLAQLRESFEFILIDSPPAVAITDALILSVMSDGVVLVFHGGKTNTASAKRLVARLDAIGAPVLGVVLNAVDLDNPDFSYYGHYHSYYSEVNPPVADHRNGKDRITSVEESWANGIQKIVATPSQDHRRDHDGATEPSIEVSAHTVSNGSNNGHPKTSPHSEKTTSPTNSSGSVIGEDLSAKSSRETEIIPQQSLDQLIESLGKSLGPKASLLVREQIASLGESFSSFPKKRMSELLKLIQRKITQRSVTFL